VKTASFEVVSDDRWRRHALCGLFTALWFIVMSGSILRLISYSLDFNNSAASHIVVVPFISTVLIYANRKKIFQDVAYSPVLAFLAFAIGGSLFVAGKRLDTGLDNPDQLALLLRSDSL
jgi:hypothetical protein